MNLQDFFSRVYIINLPERVDRKRGIERELKGIGLEFSAKKVEIFPAIRPVEKLAFPSLGILGCFLSHLEIIRTAKREGLNNVLIMEDDLAISSRFSSLEKDLLNDLKQLNWDLVFLGYSPYHNLKNSDYYNNSTNSLLSTSKYLKITQYPIVGTHFYAVNHTAYDCLISFLEELFKNRSESFFVEQDAVCDNLDGAYLDTAYYLFRQKNPDIFSLIVYPSLGWQRSSQSDITPSNISTISDQVFFLKPIINRVRYLKFRLKKILEYFNPELFN
jgi:glycosyl transferase family 25